MAKDYFCFDRNEDRMICSRLGRGQSPAPTGDHLSLGGIIKRFKTYTTIQYLSSVKKYSWSPFYEKLWQRGYYDRIIRNELELYAIRKYIINNPLNWSSVR
jgi:hypothetical protein